MLRYVAFLLLGLLVGSYATYHFTTSQPASRFDRPPARDIDPEKVVELSAAEASAERENRYESIRTIEDTLALPTDFAESEALYALAGRSSPQELQDLIYQATRIKDQADRNVALGVLFLRLTELDPLSALAIARSPAFETDRVHETAVWQAWGRLDLDAALAAAKRSGSARKNLAAQGLYASLRGADDDRASRIESELGVAPNRNAQGQRLYKLASESPASAIRFIESLPSFGERQDRYRWLAYYLHRTGRAMGQEYAHLIESPANRHAFEQALESHRLQSDPEAALQEALAGNDGLGRQQKIQQALQLLAQIDPQKALEYLEQIPDAPFHRNVEAAAAMAMARTDPNSALAWARNHDAHGNQAALVSVITQIAQDDPQLALAEAQTLSNREMRDNVYSGIANQLAINNPGEAARVLAMIEDPRSRQRSARHITSTWAQTDADAAIDWVMTLPDRDQVAALRGVSEILVHNDVDAAIRILPRLPAESAEHLQQRIVQVLAQQRSIQAAQAYVDQQKGTERHSQLQAIVLTTLAESNPTLALQMAGRVADSAARDQLMATIIGRQAIANPQQALLSLGSLSSPEARANSMTQIAHAWYSSDSAAASSWIQSLPAGADKDRLVYSTVSMRMDSPGAALRMIGEITDEGMRKEATLMHIDMLAGIDRDAAERTVQSLSLTDIEREQYRQIIERRHTIHD